MGEKIKIALVQSPLIWEDPEENRKNLSKIIDHISFGVDVIVLPEMFTTGFTMFPSTISQTEGEKSVQWMKDQAERKNAAMIGRMGYYVRGHYYNRLWLGERN